MNHPGHFDRQSAGNGIRVISFFTGAGGLDIGFDFTDFDVIYATDLEEICCATLQKNAGGLLSKNTHVEQADITKIDPATLPKDVDLIIGGPPCQSFSASGRRAGGAAGRLDARGSLFEAYCRIVEHVQPKAFLFENVRGILGTNKGEDWKTIVAAFTAIGYRLSYRILDALDYGAPQQRERMIMVGHKLDQDFLFPRPLFGPDSAGNRPYITSAEALQGLEDDEDTESLVLRSGKYAHLLPLVPPGENYLFFTAKRGYPEPIFAYRSRFSDFLYKANPAAPVKTLIASPGKYTGPLHWDNRYFTVREYMRLQGFPDDYLFEGDRRSKIKQIGNSVSPRLSYQLALSIAKQIFGRAVDMELLESDLELSFDKRKGAKAARTKAIHSKLAKSGVSTPVSGFKLFSYESSIQPKTDSAPEVNVQVEASESYACIKVKTDSSRRIFAKMQLKIGGQQVDLLDSDRPEINVDVIAYGESECTVQAMWNAVDEWVIRSSNFHSLFELYGHFTEPHPIFSILKFEVNAKNPIAHFARHVANFDNCSRYFPREHLTDLFKEKFEAADFLDLVSKLRKYRFDIRCHETNIAIPPSVYMVSYPFTLPLRKQMNFSLKNLVSRREESAKQDLLGVA